MPQSNSKSDEMVIGSSLPVTAKVATLYSHTTSVGLDGYSARRGRRISRKGQEERSGSPSRVRESSQGEMGRLMGNSEIDGGATEDLTWGYRTPQDQLYIQDKTIDERGGKSDGTKKGAQKGRHRSDQRLTGMIR